MTKDRTSNATFFYFGDFGHTDGIQSDMTLNKEDSMSEESKTQDVNSQEQQTQDVDVEKPETKTFTQEEVDQIVKDRLERQRKKDEAQRANEEQKRAEAEKLAKMNEADKQQYELDKWKHKAEDAQKKLDAYNMRAEARKMLVEKGIQATEEQLDLVVSSDADATAAKIEQLFSVVESVKDHQRRELLKGQTPSAHGSQLTKAEIQAIKDPIARRKAIADNINLYR